MFTTIFYIEIHDFQKGQFVVKQSGAEEYDFSAERKATYSWNSKKVSKKKYKSLKKKYKLKNTKEFSALKYVKRSKIKKQLK